MYFYCRGTQMAPPSTRHHDARRDDILYTSFRTRFTENPRWRSDFKLCHFNRIRTDSPPFKMGHWPKKTHNHQLFRKHTRIIHPPFDLPLVFPAMGPNTDIFRACPL